MRFGGFGMEGSGLRTQRELGRIYSLRCSSCLVEPSFHVGSPFLVYSLLYLGQNKVTLQWRL